MKIGLLLSGCGVYDGAEIQEAILAMLAIEEAGGTVVGISINKDQHHVINHTNGEVTSEKRNMLIESARITRGEIQEISQISPADIDALVIPGGFGNAKSFSTWAFDGPDGNILPEIKLLIVNLINTGRPIAALCVSPILISLALKDSNLAPILTLGTTKEKSLYDIANFNDGLKRNGGNYIEKGLNEITIDKKLKIICSPCYMQEATIIDIRKSIQLAIKELIELI
jgi:enhancing lycopene biosynthesis protein 2